MVTRSEPDCARIPQDGSPGPSPGTFQAMPRKQRCKANAEPGVNAGPEKSVMATDGFICLGCHSLTAVLFGCGQRPRPEELRRHVSGSGRLSDRGMFPPQPSLGDCRPREQIARLNSAGVPLRYELRRRRGTAIRTGFAPAGMQRIGPVWCLIGRLSGALLFSRPRCWIPA